MGTIKIHNIGTSTRNNWLLETSDGIIAVDTGLPGQSDGFLKRFTQKWSISDLKFLFLTHGHIDHAGAVAELMGKSEARLILCEKTANILAAGYSPYANEYKNWLGWLLEKSTSSKSGGYPPYADKNRLTLVRNNDTLFEELGIKARVVFLPGHTFDSIGLHLYEDDAVICGDAAMNKPLLNANKHTVMIEDLETFHDSWKLMLSFGGMTIYPGHGKPFPASDLDRYLDYHGR